MSKSSIKRHLAIVILIGIVVGFMFFMSLMSSSAECYPKSYALDFEFQGKVTAKFIDKQNHMYPIIEIDNEIEFSCAAEQSGFYNYIQLGDSVYKPEDSLIVEIYRGDDRYLRTLAYYCEE